jgi:hypothetical protein
MSEITPAQITLATQFLTTDWERAGATYAVASARKDYLALVKFYFGELDTAVPIVLGASTFAALLKRAKIEPEIVPDAWDGWPNLWAEVRKSERRATGGWGVIARNYRAVARSLWVDDPPAAWLNDLAIELMERCHAAVLASAKGR